VLLLELFQQQDLTTPVDAAGTLCRLHLFQEHLELFGVALQLLVLCLKQALLLPK